MKDKSIFAISFICGFLLALFAMKSTIAQDSPDFVIGETAEPATITIDVNNPKQSINYKEVDRYLEAENTQPVKYVKAQYGGVILSDKEIEKPRTYTPVFELPIIAAKVAKPYTAHDLKDLGMDMRDTTISKADTFTLAENEVNTVPTIPEFTPAPVATPAAISMPSVQQAAIQSSAAYTLLRLMFAVSGLLIISMLLLSRVFRAATREFSVYTGSLGAPTALVGSGKYFNFSEKPNQNPQINSTYLNMMWHLGRFSRDSNVNTYFYMAYYIPPHQDYAKALRRTPAKKMETDSKA